MIGEMEIEIGGQRYTIKANWRTAQVLAERVHDPVTFLQEEAARYVHAQAGKSYDSHADFDFVTSCRVIHAALLAAGHDVSLDDVGDHFLCLGMTPAVNIAREFIAMYAPDVEEDTTGKKSKPADGTTS